MGSKEESIALTNYIRSAIKRPVDWVDPEFLAFNSSRANIQKYIQKIINDHLVGNTDESEKIKAIRIHFSKYNKVSLKELRNCIGYNDTTTIERLLKGRNDQSSVRTCIFTMILFDIPEKELYAKENNPGDIVFEKKEKQKCGSIIPQSSKSANNEPELSSNLAASKASFSKVVGNLINSVDFKGDIYQLLINLYPNLQENVNQESEIDFFTTDEQTGDIKFAFTALDFNYQSFDKFQLDRCRKVLEQIKKLEKPVYSFVLVCKTLTKTDEFKTIKKETTELVNIGKAEYADFHDIRSFLKKVVNPKIDIEIKNKIVESNQKFKDQFQHQMDQYFYIEEIPFTIEPDSGRHTNPVVYLAESPIEQKNKFSGLEESIRKQRYSRTDSSGKWSFVVSEFGFGKTSLLLNLYKKLNQSNILSIFLPLSFFKERSLYTTSEVSKILLEILFREREFEYGDNYDRLMAGTLDNMLERRSDLILLFDGLDEHKSAYSAEGLSHIFRATAKLSAECFFTMRKEFWDDKQDNFRTALEPIKKKHQFYSLLEWSDNEILKFIDEYLEKEEIGKVEANRINQFRKLVVFKKYDQFYGDIPRRPLFLKMLIVDIVTNQIKKRSLAEIYEQYLKQKFDIDRTNHFSGKKRTPLRMEKMEDRGKVLARIFYVLEKAAASMFAITNKKECILTASVKESKIEEIKFLKEKKIGVTEILMNSILVPFGKRECGEIELKFAHKSFQEYFFARAIYTTLIEPNNYDGLNYILKSEHSDGVVTFLQGIIDSKRGKKTEFDRCIHTLSEMNDENLTPNSLLSLLTDYFSGDIQNSYGEVQF